MKLCAACHQDLPKDKFSKKQWKLGAECQRRCTSCVRDNREVQPPNKSTPLDNNTPKNWLLETIRIHDEMPRASDEDLFKTPPRKEDCPICFLRMPAHSCGWRYHSCYGKVICSGCVYACINAVEDIPLCPFCRALASTSNEENNKRMKKRLKANDPEAMYNIGCYRNLGMHGYLKDNTKVLELWHRAGELGSTTAYTNVGYAFMNGRGVKRDVKRAIHYYEIAAMKGDALAWSNLGEFEKNLGNLDRALKHYMMAVEGGLSESLDATVIRLGGSSLPVLGAMDRP